MADSLAALLQAAHEDLRAGAGAASKANAEAMLLRSEVAKLQARLETATAERDRLRRGVDAAEGAPSASGPVTEAVRAEALCEVVAGRMRAVYEARVVELEDEVAAVRERLLRAGRVRSSGLGTPTSRGETLGSPETTDIEALGRVSGGGQEGFFCDRVAQARNQWHAR